MNRRSEHTAHKVDANREEIPRWLKWPTQAIQRIAGADAHGAGNGKPARGC